MFILSPTGIAVIDLKGLESLDFLWYLRQDWREKKKKRYLWKYTRELYMAQEKYALMFWGYSSLRNTD